MSVVLVALMIASSFPVVGIVDIEVGQATTIASVDLQTTTPCHHEVIRCRRNSAATAAPARAHRLFSLQPPPSNRSLRGKCAFAREMP
jgi:hypothetical protein